MNLNLIKLILKPIPFLVSLVCFVAVIYDFGYDQTERQTLSLFFLYQLTLCIGIVSTVTRYFKKKEKPPLKVFIFDLGSILYFASVLLEPWVEKSGMAYLSFFHDAAWLYLALLLVFIREFSALKINLSRAFFNPAQLFIMSFLAIILIGSGMLSLPNASISELSFIDALFTSTSAVCVTGLVVVDTGQHFTLFGQSIILVLIQIGGLGIMTIASYFGYFFKGGTTYENQLMLSDMTSSEKLGEVFSTLKKIIIVTISIEALGALLIFSNLESASIPSFIERVYFSVFHAISAFCNAGFSTLSESLYALNFRFNYPLQLSILGLFVIGGLGFPIVFNLFNYLKYLIRHRILPFLLREERENTVMPWVINLNSRIVLITSTVLLVVGTTVFFVFEYNNSLSEHGAFGKVVTSLFSAATPRTAGFNTVDTGSLNFSTLMLLFLLMWIGASPASTGGGIKTNTFAIATLNFWSLARGKDRIEVFRREIADISIRRAFAIISLSLVVIGMGVFSIAYLDSEKDLLSIAFECFSAYSTVGLSVGITDQLSSASKGVIIIMMFVGRVSMLSILIAVVRKEKYKNYRYSKEEILIN
ncbi:MAG: potassium transporter TrkG [Vicingaceae bacterium]